MSRRRHWTEIHDNKVLLFDVVLSDSLEHRVLYRAWEADGTSRSPQMRLSRLDSKCSLQTSLGLSSRNDVRSKISAMLKLVVQNLL